MLKAVKNHIHEFIQSATDPSAYPAYLQKSLTSSLLYFCATVFWISILSLLFWRTLVFPKFLDFASKEAEYALSQVPESTVFTLNEGNLQVEGAEDPLEIESSMELQDSGYPTLLASVGENPSRAMFQFDTTTIRFTVPQDDMDETPTLTYEDLFQTKNGSVTKQQLTDAVNSFLRESPSFATALSIILLPVVWIGVVLASLLTLAFFTFITQTLAWVVFAPIVYIKCFQLGLYAMSVSLVLEMLHVFFFPQIAFPFLTISFFGILFLVFFTMRQRRHKGA